VQRAALTKLSQVGYSNKTEQKSCINHLTQAPLPDCTACKVGPAIASTPSHHGTSIWPLTLPCIVLVQQQQHLGQLATGPPQQPCMWMWPCQRSSSRSPGPTSTRCPSSRRQPTSRRWCASGWKSACGHGRAFTTPSFTIKSSGKDRSVSLLTISEQKSIRDVLTLKIIRFFRWFH